jgi:hypothetical protein
MPPLAFFSAFAIAATAFATATFVAVTPAQATGQSFAGTTVDVRAPASGDNLIGSTAYVPVTGGTLQPFIPAPIATDIVVTISRVGATVGTCTIFAGGTFCNINTGSSLVAGATAVTVRFATAGSTADFAGTLFAVTGTAPSVGLEWQDAAGRWIDGTGAPLPLLGNTALRCVVTNNSNAPMTFGSFYSSVTPVSGSPVTTAITGNLAAGAVGYYVAYSGPVSNAGGGSCSGSVTFASGSGSGSGNGLGISRMTGTIVVNQTPAPGTTVTVTGDNVGPTSGSYSIRLDDVAVAGSPVSTTSPDFDFTLDVNIPALIALGVHTVTVVETSSGRNAALAAFPFTVPEPVPSGSGNNSQLAATGPALSANTVAAAATLASLVMVAGAALIVSARRRRS